METINLSYTGFDTWEDEPFVFGNYKKGIIDISNRLSSQTYVLTEFHQELTSWIIEYFHDWLNDHNTLIINFKITHFDTAGQKFLYMLFNFLEGYVKWYDKTVVVNWYCEADDEDMLEAVDFYQSEAVGLKFNTIIVSNLSEDIDNIIRSWFLTNREGVHNLTKQAKKLALSTAAFSEAEEEARKFVPKIERLVQQWDIDQKYAPYYVAQLTHTIVKELLKDKNHEWTFIRALENSIK